MQELITITPPDAETRPLANRLIGVFFAVAVLGWGASALLTAIHFWVLPLPATIEPQGAMQVITSPWAYVGPLPLATIGAVYYIGMMAAAALWMTTKSPLLERLLLPVTGLGVLFSAYFVYLQFVPIGAICPFCMVSAAATTALFGIELLVKRVGGARSAPEVRTAVVWPVTVAAPLLMTLAVMWSLTVLPLPGQ